MVSAETWNFINIVPLRTKSAETLASYASKRGLIYLGEDYGPSLWERWRNAHYVTEVLGHGFQLLESRACEAIRENNSGADLADLV